MLVADDTKLLCPFMKFSDNSGFIRFLSSKSEQILPCLNTGNCTRKLLRNFPYVDNDLDFCNNAYHTVSELRGESQSLRWSAEKFFAFSDDDSPNVTLTYSST